MPIDSWLIDNYKKINFVSNYYILSTILHLKFVKQLFFKHTVTYSALDKLSAVENSRPKPNKRC